MVEHLPGMCKVFGAQHHRKGKVREGGEGKERERESIRFLMYMNVCIYREHGCKRNLGIEELRQPVQTRTLVTVATYVVLASPPRSSLKPHNSIRAAPSFSTAAVQMRAPVITQLT